MSLAPRVDGKPKMVSERYLGSAADVAAAVAGGEAAIKPERTRHLAFGDVAAVWEVLTCLDVIGIVDAVTGGEVAGAGASTGTYLALAALNRVVAPCSKLGFADWWKTTAADRFTKIGASVLDHRRFWDAMHAVSLAELAEIERRVTAAMIERFDLDTSALALDMTNFATYIDTGNAKAPIAQRGKAKQKRSDLRLVGLGLVITRDGGIPVVSHAYAGNRPDVTQFTTMIKKLTGGYQELLAVGPHTGAGEVTVVFDAGQNSTANFAYLTASGLGYVGSVPPSDHPDLLALPASARRPVDTDRFAGLTALTTRRTIYGVDRRVVLTHSAILNRSATKTVRACRLCKVPSALIDRVRQLWVALAGVEVGSFSVSVPRVVVSPDSKICLPGWVGIVAINDAVLITAVSPAAARQLDCALRALALDEVTDVSALSAVLPIAEVLGPAWLSYLAQEDLPMRPGDQAVERLPSGHRDLTRLRGAASQDEADESGLAEITSDAFVIRQAGEVISAAGFRRWPCDVAHMSVLTAMPARGQGLATRTASAAVEEALRQDLLPQWRARPASSRRVSAHLGFQELGKQLSVRLDDTLP